MATYSTADIRNVMLAGHGGSGKTSLADALLFASATVNRKASVVDGSSFSDFEKEEKEHKHSIYAAILHADHLGKRININYTRAMVGAAISGALDTVEMVADPIFGLRSPTSCPDVPSELLIPRNTWPDKEAYDRAAADLAARFKKNFTQFTLPSDDVRNAGPK